MTFKELIEKFNIAANTAFNKGYQELEPGLKDFAYKFMSGDVPSTDFPITKIMSKISEFTGNRKHNSPADGFLITIKNKEFDGSVDIPRRDMKRAMKTNSLTGLDLFVKEIAALGEEAKDTPFEAVLDMVEAGHTNTYGTCFDGQNLYDTTHAFDNKAGTQSNIVTGTGTTAAQVAADLKKAFTALRSFYHNMDSEGNMDSKKRMLNKRTVQIKVLCPSEMVETFEDLNKAEYLADGVTNTMRGRIQEVIARPLGDSDDWYVVDFSESNVRPIILSEEEAPLLDTPSASDNNVKEHKVYTYGLEGFSWGKGYGAWWKTVKVANA